jgi:hypothetical protein
MAGPGKVISNGDGEDDQDQEREEDAPTSSFLDPDSAPHPAS